MRGVEKILFLLLVVVVVLLSCFANVVQSATTKTTKTTKTAATKTKEQIPNISIDNFGEVLFISVEHFLPTEEISNNVTRAATIAEVGEIVLKRLSKTAVKNGNVKDSFLHSDPFGKLYTIETMSKTTQSLISNNNNNNIKEMPISNLNLEYDKSDATIHENATTYLNIISPLKEALNWENNVISYCVGRAASNLLSNQFNLEALATTYGTYSTKYLKSKFTYEVSKSSFEKELVNYNTIVRRFNTALDNLQKLILKKQELVKQQQHPQQ